MFGRYSKSSFAELDHSHIYLGKNTLTRFVTKVFLFYLLPTLGNNLRHLRYILPSLKSSSLDAMRIDLWEPKNGDRADFFKNKLF